jgi:NTP pyrophosphatase (non-canonical NTP hydrolase)
MSNPIVPLMAIMANVMEKEELVKAVQEKCTECNNLYLSGKKKEADEVFALLGMYCQMILIKLADISPDELMKKMDQAERVHNMLNPDEQ